MAKDERAEDCKVGGLGPRSETSIRSDAISVMSWSIESEIVHSSEIG